ncbi:MAG: DUF4886 domain-containing protein [Bacilli bacterium]|nr:DUF4886 domain-containing protein [Bacilli bacterium]
MKKISVLMIGNSFSVDAARYTHQISVNSGIEIELGVLYVGGCSLEMHVNFIKEGSTPYEWFINGESTGKYISLKDALLMKKWDYITLQQVSVYSGLLDTFYPYINQLIDYVRKYQKESILVLHKTWPYETGFDNTNFAHYNYDRKIMYQSINKAYESVAKDLGINLVIRSGDIIEAAIEKYGEHFHKDGFHLNDEGRYLAALGFVHTFNQNKTIKELYIPEGFNKDKCIAFDEFVSQVLNK